MAIATRTTQGGNTIKVEVRRSVHDDIFEGIVMGRKAIETTTITLLKGGKVLAWGSSAHKLHPQLNANLIAKGAVARLGDAYLSAEAASLLDEALAEASTAEAADDEFWALKNAAAEAKAAAERRTEADAPRIEEYEAFARRMDDPNSDL